MFETQPCLTNRQAKTCGGRLVENRIFLIFDPQIDGVSKSMGAAMLIHPKTNGRLWRQMCRRL
jgi:hypothetical protein